MKARKWSAAAALVIVLAGLSVWSALGLVFALQAHALEATEAPHVDDGSAATEPPRDSLDRLDRQLEFYAASEINLRSRLAAERRHAETALAVLARLSSAMRAAEHSGAPQAVIETAQAISLAHGAYRMASVREQALQRGLAELAIATSLAQGERETILADRAAVGGRSAPQEDSVSPVVQSPRSRPTTRNVSFAKAKGRVRLPVDGDIIAGFGDLTKTGLKSRGLVLEVPPGARVTAPFAGKIRFAGAFRDYGHVLIIDHGDGYHSLLAGLSRIDASIDDWVTGGEQVGAIEGAPAERPSLLFELWRERVPVNPLPWVRVFTVKESR